jgi:uncharacterized protein
MRVAGLIPLGAAGSRIMPMDHTLPYEDAYLRDILTSVRTIAVVGASPRASRPSFGVVRTLVAAGYEVIPVNPMAESAEIQGLRVFESLAEIGRDVDMVDVFRAPDALYGVTEEAIAIGARVLWTQLGVIDYRAARLAEEAGMRVVMNRCPAIELPRLGLGAT